MLPRSQNNAIPASTHKKVGSKLCSWVDESKGSLDTKKVRLAPVGIEPVHGGMRRERRLRVEGFEDPQGDPGRCVVE